MDIESAIYLKRLIGELLDIERPLGDSLSKRYDFDRALRVLEEEIRNNRCVDCSKFIGDGASLRCYECRVKCGNL